MDPLTLLLADSRFPSGSYAHSLGLEQAVADGLRDVPAFIAARQRWVAEADARFAVEARRAAACVTSGHELPVGPLARLDEEWAARCPSPALRAAARRLGAQLLRTAAVAFGAPLRRAAPAPRAAAADSSPATAATAAHDPAAPPPAAPRTVAAASPHAATPHAATPHAATPHAATPHAASPRGAAAAIAAYRDASRLTPRPIALGVVAAVADVSDVDTALLALYDDAATVASAALKLLPLDPAVTVGWLAALAPSMALAARAIAADTGPLPAPAAVAIELSAPIHLQQRERLFAS